jgi:hypothetical protein
MVVLVIYFLVAFVLAGIAAYKYGRVHPDVRGDLWEDLIVSVVLFIIFWPVVLPLALIATAIYFPLRWIYQLGDRSREKDSK